MSLFEFTFGLQAIILGLGLTHLVIAVNRLVLSRERVKWAAQPLLAAALVMTMILLLWTQSWAQRDVAATTIGEVILRVLMNLLMFAAAYAVLPEEVPEGRTTDLAAHFEKVRIYFFGLFALVITGLGILTPLVLMALGKLRAFDNWANVWIVAALAVCMVVKNRWVNLAVMAGLLLFILTVIQGYELAAG